MKPFSLIEATVAGLTWLTAHTFEIRFHRPAGYTFQPGQKVEVLHQHIRRTYTLLSNPQDAELAFCVRHIPTGRLSPVLAQAQSGQKFYLSPAFGFFLFQPSNRPVVFVATGTGIAPFVAYARTGVRGFCLLHGVRAVEELYYRDVILPCAASFVPCLSRYRPLSALPAHDIFFGRVTDYIADRLPEADYDFYLCGRGEMLRDAVRIIDKKFPGARVFSETFF